MGITKLKDRIYSKFNASNYSDSSSTNTTSSSTPYNPNPTYPYDPYNTQYQQYQQPYQYQAPPSYHPDQNAYNNQGAYPTAYPPPQMGQPPYGGYAQPYTPAYPDPTQGQPQAPLEKQLAADDNTKQQQSSEHMPLQTPEHSGPPVPASNIDTTHVDATTSSAPPNADLPTYKSTQDEELSTGVKVLEKTLGVAKAEKVDKMTAEERREHVRKYLRESRSKGYYGMYAGGGF